ncbi:MAG: SAM-dependent methyltransferase [Myxococcaceae bacterium]|nr:SAM-dependent methyltransferase [Myxococcaceae bacterium]
MAPSFPLYLPSDFRRAFASDTSLRRIAKTAHWGADSKILDLSGGATCLFLAKELGCSVIVADTDTAAASALNQRIAAKSLGDRITVKVLPSWEKLPFAEGEFDGVIAVGRVMMPLEKAASTYRPLLAPKGRLVLSYPARIGRVSDKQSLAFWEQQLGEPLALPRQCLGVIERNGYEPELTEALSDSELDDYYREIESSLSRLPAEAQTAASPLKSELALFRELTPRAGYTLALFGVRRKEPGEPPPPSRHGG